MFYEYLKNDLGFPLIYPALDSLIQVISKPYDDLFEESLTLLNEFFAYLCSQNLSNYAFERGIEPFLNELPKIYRKRIENAFQIKRSMTKKEIETLIKNIVPDKNFEILESMLDGFIIGFSKIGFAVINQSDGFQGIVVRFSDSITEIERSNLETVLKKIITAGVGVRVEVL
mgnify:CR=1 FL=1